MDDDFGSDVLNINLDEGTFQQLVDEVGINSDREMNVKPDYSDFDSLTLIGQQLLRERQDERFQSTQPSTSLPTSDMTTTTHALLQKQAQDNAALDFLELRSERVEDRYEHAGFQSSKPFTSLPPRDSAVDGVPYSDITDVSAEENPFYWPSQEDSHDSDVEIHSTLDYAALESLGLRSHHVEDRYQHVGFQSSQHSTSLPPRDSAIDGVQYSNFTDVSDDENTFDSSSQENSDDSDMEVNFLQDYATLDYRLRSKPAEEAHQDESPRCCQPSTSFQPSELPPTTETLSQNQDHSQRVLMYNMLQNPEFRTYDAAVIVPEGVPSSESDAHTAVSSTSAQQDMEHESLHQQLCSELTIPPFPLPLPHTSMAMQNREPLTIPEERNSPSREVLVECQSVEPNSRQMSRLEEMQELTKTFIKMRSILGFSQKDVSLVLAKLSGKCIDVQLMGKFDGFNLLFDSMCHLKSLLERLQEDVRMSRISRYFLRNGSESVDCSLETTATTEHQEIGEDDVVNQDDSAESVNSTISGNCKLTTNKKAVSGNKNSRSIVPRFNEKALYISTLLSQDVVRACKFLQLEPKQVSLEEVLQFVEKFKIWRKELVGFSRVKVLSELKGRYRIQVAKRCIEQFENFTENFERMYEMKPATEEWLKDIHISETHSPIFGTPLRTLQENFRENPNPNAEQISSLAKSVKLDNAFVTIWFQKRRQIQDCINSPTPMDKENISQDHLQRALMPQNPQFGTHHTDVIVPEGVSLPEADAHTAVASPEAQQDMEPQSLHQQICSELTNTPFPLTQPHTSMAMQNREPLTVPEEQNPISREVLVESQSTDSNPPQICSLEDVQKLTEHFSKMRSILGFSIKDISSVLTKLSGKCIGLKLMGKFDGFNVLFENMCHLKSLLEPIQKDFETSRTTSRSLWTTSEYISLQGHETIARRKQQEMENDLLQHPKPGTEEIVTLNFNTRTNGAVSNDRPDNTTSEDMGGRMSKGRSDGYNDVIGEDDVNQDDPSESVNSSVSGNSKSTTNKQAVPKRFTGNNSSRCTASRFNNKTVYISSLLSPGMVRGCKFLQSQRKQVSLEEMLQFVENFKKWRKYLLDFHHKKVVLVLEEWYGIQISTRSIEEFEGFNVTFKRIYEMRSVAEAWLKDIHISKTQGPIFGTRLDTLQHNFQRNPHPNADEISSLARSVNLDNAFVTIWFQKRRQIQDCINSPTTTSTDKDKENISPVS